MKVWITKHALTVGIESAFGKIVQDKYFKSEGSWLWCNPGEWFDTEEKAKANAEERRQKKIKSLYKQIDKLKALTFQ